MCPFFPVLVSNLFRHGFLYDKRIFLNYVEIVFVTCLNRQVQEIEYTKRQSSEIFIVPFSESFPSTQILY